MDKDLPEAIPTEYLKHQNIHTETSRPVGPHTNQLSVEHDNRWRHTVQGGTEHRYYDCEFTTTTTTIITIIFITTVITIIRDGDEVWSPGMWETSEQDWRNTKFMKR